MSKLQMLRALLKQRRDAADGIVGLFGGTTYQCKYKVNLIHNGCVCVSVFPANVQQLLVIKEEDPPQWSPNLEQKHPEPLHIKEEQDEVWTSQEGEQLNRLEEPDITRFPSTAVPVKSEDEEKPQSSQLHQSQTEDNREAEPPVSSSATQIKTESDGEDCGGSEPARNQDPDGHSQLSTDEKTSDSSETEVSDDEWQEPLSDCGPETEDSDSVWKTRAPESDVDGLKYNEAPVSVVGHNTDKKSFRCFECGKQFHCKWCLQRHMMCHLGKRSSSCLVNKKCFTVKQKENSKMRVHTGEKRFGCDVCGKRFTRKTDLIRHMRIHTGEKPCGCDVCGKKFSRETNLKTHMKVHTGEKPFGCGVCGKRFNRETNLKMHMQVHTGEKPFGCDVCGKRFTQHGSLKRHMPVHTGEKPFSCDVCGKRFNQRTHLKRHMKGHTGRNPVDPF
ncbi:zinc finger protein 260-like [Pempheris klunzingeri]|uniref:zinc finger protein 260-like n=1 Tax=Pempheris klunzingeri TaxID=3127111 RepID=UPI00397EE5EA